MSTAADTKIVSDEFSVARSTSRASAGSPAIEHAFPGGDPMAQRLIALLPTAIYVCEAPSGRITFFNRQAARLWGREPALCDPDERFCGSFRLWRPDGMPLGRDQTPMALALREGREFRNLPVVIERPDGTRIDVRVSIDPIRDPSGKVVGAINAFQDVTSERVASEALLESERGFREMIDALPTAIYTTDDAGRITYFNPAAAEFTGRVPTLGSDEWCVSWKLFHPDGTPMPHDQCPMAIALKEGRIMWGAEAIAERPDGERRWFQPFPTPLRDAEGRVIGGINMLVDITERKRIEEALRASEAHLKADLAANRQLQTISAELVREDGAEDLYQKIVEAAAALMGSDCASMQMLHPERGICGELRLLASRGFTPQAAQFWEWVRADSESSCGMALRTRQRAIASDVESCDFMAGTDDRTTYLQAGIRAVQSTPLLSRSGRLLGMISTHWRKPYDPPERDLQRLDVLARQAADLIERAQAQARVLGHRCILERVATGAPLNETLDDVMRFLEMQEPGARCGLLIVTEDGKRFRRGSGPSLPEHYHRALDGVPITPPYLGSCGEAAHCCESVVVPDIRSDTRYAPEWRELTLSCGLQAVRSTPVRSGDGRVLGSLAIYYGHPCDPTPAHSDLIAIGTHLTAIALERARAAEDLREEARVQELLRNVSQALAAAQLDLERVVQVATDAATELSGAAFGSFFYNVTDDKGESYLLYTLSGAPREAFARFPQPRNTAVFGPTFRGEGVVRSADITADPRYGQNSPYRGMPQGHLPVRSYLAVPVKTASGEVLGGLFFGHPQPGVFTERAERLVLAIAAQAAVAFDNARLHQSAKQELVQRRRLEQALSDGDRRKDEFLAMLAHELRNPLAPISNAGELLSRTIGEDSRARLAIDMIKRQTTHLTRLVDDLLDVSRITQGRIQLRRRPLDLTSVITQAIETAEPQLRAKGHRLSTIAESYEPLYVSGDHARLVQCVANVLTNAIKYTDPGGEIRIQSRAEGETAVIEITDSGAGIAPELLPKVFDLFVQSDRTLDRA